MRNVRKRISSVRWSINGSNSAYSSVNAVLNVPSPKVAFNCGEGLQRIIGAGHLASIRNIFITRLDWRCVGGLHGALLMQNTGRGQQATVFGPSTLKHLCDEIVFDLPREELDVITVDCGNGHICTDNAFRIRAIPLRNPSEEHAKVIAYAGEVEASQSAIRIEKCVDLNVMDRTLMSQLQNGLEITLDDGTVIRPEDVINFYPKLHFLVIDIPNIDYLHHLENSEIILNAEEAENTVLHFSPPNIIASSEYQNYMRKFPAGTVHMTTNDEFTFSGYTWSHKQQTQLNHISGQIFPTLGEKIDDVYSNHEKSNSNDCSEKDICVESLIPNRTFNLRPTKSVEDNLKLEPKKWLEDLTNSTEKQKSIKWFHKLHMEHILKHPIIERAKEYPKMVFLGTGASVPRRVRNVSGILLHLSPTNSMLLDCGESTLGQMFRLYGDQTHDVLKNLKAIFISHMHLDHFMGLFNVLRQAQEIKSAMSKQQPVAVIGPNELKSRLDIFNTAVQDLNGSYDFISNNQLMGQKRAQYKDQLCIPAVGLIDIETCFVPHIQDSFGVSLSVRRSHDDSAFKLTYSGDTEPCRSLIEIGMDSTVLIHEATFEDDLAAMAHHKQHSTISQAVSQGVDMNAKHTILTHFSQRSRWPRVNQPLPHNVTIAIDYMELVESDLTLAPHLYEVLRSIHRGEMDEYDTKAEKRNTRKETFM